MTLLPTLITFFGGCMIGAGILWLTQNAIMRERSKGQQAQTKALTTLRGEIEEQLKVLTGDALQKSQQSFLTLAKAQFDENQKVVQSENDKKEKAIKNLLEPVSETLKEYKQSLAAIESKRQEAYGNISQELEM